MSEGDLITLWSNNRALSIVIWMVLVITVLYFARPPAHGVIRAFSRMLRNAMRMAATSLQKAEQRLVQRNKEVLLAAGREQCERLIDREFQRVAHVVMHDLSEYPSLQRHLKEQITRIEEDYACTMEVPPMPPAWHAAVEAVARIPANGDPAMAKILNDINAQFSRAGDNALREYRASANERHRLLSRLLPFWRRLSHSLDSVAKKIDGLEERARVIDNQIEQYGQILAGSDRAERMLSSSALTQFFISGIVLLIAVLGAFINFQLIALPMSEMVGGNSYLFLGAEYSLKTADVAALVIIFVEIAMGLFLMESLHITRLFPVIHSMDDKMRKRMMWATLTILVILAGIESALAYMRDLLSADKEALTQSLAGVTVAMPAFRWVPSVGQMVMGFILPFALVFVAIPLESFIHSSRTVIGAVVGALLRTSVFLVRWYGNFALSLGNIMVHFYDMIIFIPLRIEHSIRKRTQQNDAIETLHDVGLPDPADPPLSASTNDAAYQFDLDDKK